MMYDHDNHRYLKSKSPSPELEAKIQYMDTDFFKYEVTDDKKFDLIYDFTYVTIFLIALCPRY